MAVLRVTHVWGNRLLEVAHLSRGALGPVEVDGGLVRLDGAQVAVEPGQAKELEWGGTKFRLEWSEPVEQVKPKTGDELDWRFASLLVCLLLLGVGSVALFRLDVAYFMGDSDELSYGAPLKLSERLIKPLRPERHASADRLRAEKKEGQAGKPDEKRAQSSSTPRKLEVQRAGLLGALEDLGGVQVFSGGSSDAINAGLGNLRGPASGDAHGLGGMGPRGNGPGGGGIGPGGFGARLTHGGPGGFGLGLKDKSSEEPAHQRTVVSDGLPRDVVARVIRRHESEIKFCYEQALQHVKGLKGKVTVMFTIGPAGDVTDASVADTTLASSEVEACMQQRILRWKFPEPKGGGVVTVTHPWIFSEAGADEE